jgi:hypothetical protein
MRRGDRQLVPRSIALERIPTGLVAVLAAAAVVTPGAQARGEASEVVAKPAAAQRSTAPAAARLAALRPERPRGRVTGRVSLRLSEAAGPRGRIGIAVRSPRLGRVRAVRVAVDGVRVARMVPPRGRFAGASGWIHASLLRGGRHRVTVEVVRRGAVTLRASRWTTAGGDARRGALRRPAPAPPAEAGGRRILWGAWIDGDAYGPSHDDPPWDMAALSVFERNAGKAVSILHYGQFWRRAGVPQPFYAGDHQRVRDRGAIPLLDWNPWDASAAGATTQPEFRLARIAAGDHDAYIRSWAAAARDWGHPLFLRLAHEMNGDWFPWSEKANGNAPGEFVAAWRHVHDLFAEVGATNVTWVWSPNAIHRGGIPLAGLYPGDAYVDWVAIDGYNWGTNPARPNAWASFAEVFGPTYDALGSLAPRKPVMLAELGSTEHGGSKATWITDALAAIPARFPRIAAVVWFNWDTEGMDWSIESSESAARAFRDGIAHPVYAGSRFADLLPGAIPPTDSFLPVVQLERDIVPHVQEGVEGVEAPA